MSAEGEKLWKSYFELLLAGGYHEALAVLRRLSELEPQNPRIAVEMKALVAALEATGTNPAGRDDSGE